MEYNYDQGGTINQQTVTIISDAQFKSYLNLHRVFTDNVAEMRAVAQDELNKRGLPEAGTVTAVSGDKVTGTTESGIPKVGRDAT